MCSTVVYMCDATIKKEQPGKTTNESKLTVPFMCCKLSPVYFIYWTECGEVLFLVDVDLIVYNWLDTEKNMTKFELTSILIRIKNV